MPTHINGRPVKTGSWVQEEDDLLSEWQAKLGNRLASYLLSLVVQLLASQCRLPSSARKGGLIFSGAPVQKQPGGVTRLSWVACTQVVICGEEDPWQDGPAVRAALAAQGAPASQLGSCRHIRGRKRQGEAAHLGGLLARCRMSVLAWCTSYRGGSLGVPFR